MNRCWHKCDGQVGEGSNNNVRHVTGANILPIFSHNLQVADVQIYISVVQNAKFEFYTCRFI